MTLKQLFVTALLVGAPSVALAQPDPETGGEVSGEGSVEVGASADASVETAPAEAEMSASAEAAGGATALVNAPLVLSEGLLRAQADLGITRLTVAVAGTTASATNETLRVGVGYGIADKIEAGISYAFSIHDFEAKGLLNVYGRYAIKSDAKLRVAATGSFGYNFLGENAGLGLGVAAYYHINEKMGLYTPGQQLSIGLGDGNVVALELPVGFELQATPNLYVFAQTSIASIGIHPSGSSIIFADSTPLAIGAFYAPSNKLDFGLTFATGDVPHVDDAFSILLTARIFSGTAGQPTAPTVAAL